MLLLLELLYLGSLTVFILKFEKFLDDIGGLQIYILIGTLLGLFQCIDAARLFKVIRNRAFGLAPAHDNV